MEYYESLIIYFWENPEEQLLQIEKEIEHPQIEEKRKFLEDYKQAFLEFLDAFDIHSLLKKKYDYYFHAPLEERESFASELFRKYSFWNNECEYYEVNLDEESKIINSNILNLEAISAVLPKLKEFLNLFSTSYSNEKFFNECISHFSLSSSQVEYILSLPLSRLKDVNQQAITNEIEKLSAISEFIDRLTIGYWERQVTEEDNVEVTYLFRASKKIWEKYSKRVEEDKFEITYFFDTEKNDWEKNFKMEYAPSLNCYTWDKQNEIWQLIN